MRSALLATDKMQPLFMLLVGLEDRKYRMPVVLSGGKKQRVATRLNINIETVVIDSGARATALSSGKVDLLFWTQSIGGEGEPTDKSDIPEGTAISDPYFKTEPAILALAD